MREKKHVETSAGGQEKCRFVLGMGLTTHGVCTSDRRERVDGRPILIKGSSRKETSGILLPIRLLARH